MLPSIMLHFAVLTSFKLKYSMYFHGLAESVVSYALILALIVHYKRFANNFTLNCHENHATANKSCHDDKT
jgi:hypothetical protein